VEWVTIVVYGQERYASFHLRGVFWSAQHAMLRAGEGGVCTSCQRIAMNVLYDLRAMEE